jgi:hypothetical protein
MTETGAMIILTPLTDARPISSMPRKLSKLSSTQNNRRGVEQGAE